MQGRGLGHSTARLVGSGEPSFVLEETPDPRPQGCQRLLLWPVSGGHFHSPQPPAPLGSLGKRPWGLLLPSWLRERHDWASSLVSTHGSWVRPPGSCCCTLNTLLFPSRLHACVLQEAKCCIRWGCRPWGNRLSPEETNEAERNVEIIQTTLFPTLKPPAHCIHGETEA